jgi:uncharacterized protein YbjT (DUF2867 family)
VVKDEAMKILVIGGTGKVGSLLVAKLLAGGADVRVLARSAERAQALPAAVAPAIADITADVEAAAAAFAGIDAVFMLNRPLLVEMPEGLLAVALARAAGVRRFVFQSVHTAEKMGHIPHVASKLAIERAVRGSGMEWIFLRPNYFYQNDLTAQAGLEKGLYTAPIGNVGVASVDADDIAEAAATCLLDDGHGGRSYNLIGPEVLTGETCAATWSEVLGRQIRYVGDPDAWRTATRDFMPPWFNYDLGMMYRHLGMHGMPPEPGDMENVTTLLGRAPRCYRDYVLEQAAEWGWVDASTLREALGAV